MNNAFPKLSKIGLLYIHRNSDLGSLDNAFPEVSKIGSLSIYSNYNLGSMDNAFPSILEIGNLYLCSNSNLGSLDNAFPKLSKIVARLDISNNPVLLSIEGSFNGLLTVGVHGIKITDNGLIMFDNCFKKISQPEPSLEFSQQNIPSLGPVSVMNKETREGINVALIGPHWEFIQSKFQDYYTTSNPTGMYTLSLLLLYITLIMCIPKLYCYHT